MVTLLSFMLVIGVVVVVHEFGHFIAARSVGIRVERFSVGFPPRMIGKRFGDTDYCLSWIPLGGYVKMAGMIDESFDMSASEFDPRDPRLFMNKKSWQKVLVVCAGVLMNMVLAAVVLWAVYSTRGVPSLPEQISTVIDRPISGYPAQKAGLVRGDRIVSVDGVPVKEWPELVAVIYERPAKEIVVEYERGGERGTVTLTTRSENQAGRDAPVGKIGIAPMLEFERLGVGEAFVTGCLATWTILERTAESIGMLVVGRASVRDLAGPVGIAKMTGETAQQGVGDLFELLALISVNIGFLNILPIPALDGGHLVMVVIEGVRRRPLSTRFKLGIQQVGMILLLALIAVVVFNDFMRLR
jgi:regulator of sigma E protease